MWHEQRIQSDCREAGSVLGSDSEGQSQATTERQRADELAVVRAVEGSQVIPNVSSNLSNATAVYAHGSACAPTT